MGNGRNIITDIVIKYIPIGTSFDDAEAILRAAGFKVSPREQNPIFHDLYEVNAVIDQYVTALFGNTSINVVLRPKNKDDWSAVQSLEAEITIQWI